MKKGGTSLNVSGGVVNAVDELLKLGILNKMRMIVLAPTKPSEPLQVTAYAKQGQAKVRLIPDQRRLGIAIRSRLKLMAGMTLRKDTEQFGRIVFSLIDRCLVPETVINVTATPTKYGEVIILVF